jgi:DNA-binding NtrC family response regulator
MHHLLGLVAKAAVLEAAVPISGETGIGKGPIARATHRLFRPGRHNEVNSMIFQTALAKSQISRHAGKRESIADY